MDYRSDPIIAVIQGEEVGHLITELVSSPGESHPKALAEPYVNVSAHTAPIIQPKNRLCLNHELLPFRVDPQARLNDVAPSLHVHYKRFITTTSNSAPVSRIGTLILIN